MNISIITTVDHNVGDDFVREGIIYLLRQKFGEINVFNIHKHTPVTVRMGFEHIRSLRLSKFLDLLPLSITKDKILSSDLLVQSGAPVYWCHDVGGSHCADNEWYAPLIKKRFLKIKNRTKLINIAAGTCQRYHSNGSEFKKCDRCSVYIKELYSTSAVTTVRDSLAQSVLQSLGLDVPLIPCTSIFACDGLGIVPGDQEYVCLNYMPVGGHYGFGQDIDANHWQAVFKEFYKKIKDREKCVLVCHDAKEVNAARRIIPDAEIFFSRDYRDYIRFYAKAKFGIVNRVHGAFAMASFGRPSFVVGTDTRAKMVTEIGLRNGFVKNITLEKLLEEYELLKDDMYNYKTNFDKIKKKALIDYQNALSVL